MMSYRHPHFGPYSASFTTGDDVEEVLALIESKETLEASKRDAVYKRRAEILIPSITNGFFTKIERVADGEGEVQALGGRDRRIVGITGAYLLATDDKGHAAPIRTEMAMDRQYVASRSAEIGTTLVIRDNDLPNEDGFLPKRSFYKLLVAAATLNLFKMAGQEIGGHIVNFDTITANVQNRVEMRTIMNWLTSAPLGWRMIERPSVELIQATSSTTEDASDFQARDKFFYELSPAALPLTAKYLLDAWKTGRIVSDHEHHKNIVHVDLDFSPEFINFLNAVKSSVLFFRDNEKKRIGLSDVRRRLYLPDRQDGLMARSAGRPVISSANDEGLKRTAGGAAPA